MDTSSWGSGKRGGKRKVSLKSAPISVACRTLIDRSWFTFPTISTALPTVRCASWVELVRV